MVHVGAEFILLYISLSFSLHPLVIFVSLSLHLSLHSQLPLHLPYLSISWQRKNNLKREKAANSLLCSTYWHRNCLIILLSLTEMEIYWIKDDRKSKRKKKIDPWGSDTKTQCMPSFLTPKGSHYRLPIWAKILNDDLSTRTHQHDCGVYSSMI
jgi:hypothetical protein